MVPTAFNAVHNQRYCRKCENNEEIIVFFQSVFVVFVVMIFVKRPQKTMHHVLMRDPSNALHDNKFNKNESDIQKHKITNLFNSTQRQQFYLKLKMVERQDQEQ